MEPETFQVNHLHDFEVAYELSIRKTKTTRNLLDQRKILRRLLSKEKNQPGGLIDLTSYNFDFEKEQREIEKSFYEITEAIMDFADSGDQNDNLFSRIKSRIAHVSLRTKNLDKSLHIPDIVNADDRQRVENYFNESNATCLKLEGDLYDNIKVPNTTATAQTSSQSTPVINVAAPIVTCSGNSIPISEWGVKFNGDAKHLFSFLERVTELAHARRVSNLDLFNSAVELFVGDAFAWYRCNRTNLNNWDELVALLKKDFLHSDAEDQIWEQIKHRKQRKNESVSIFIAHMETFFSRLSRLPVEVTKVKLIRQNLLPEFISQLALVDITSISELMNYCRKLEEANYLKNKNKPHEVSELNERQGTSNFYYGNKFRNEHRNYNNNNNKFQKRFSNNNHSIGTANKNDNKTNSPSGKKSVNCWNCGLANHTYHDCRAPRKLFCFKCGMTDVKSKDCKSCSKN